MQHELDFVKSPTDNPMVAADLPPPGWTTMAENESLDLCDPGGQRWNHVHDAVRKGLSAEQVARIARRKLPRALAKAFKEFIEAGVPFDELLQNRHDCKTLDRLVRKAKGHQYAHLFAETAKMEAAGDDRQLIGSYLDGIVERVSDQIVQAVGGSARWPNYPGVREFLGDVRRYMADDMRRIATKLAKDPKWLPTIGRESKGDAPTPTHELLSMSMLGNAKK
jgi:hypothetical protein